MRIGAGRNWSTLIVDRDAICDATDGAGVFICLSPYPAMVEPEPPNDGPLRPPSEPSDE